MPFVRAKIGALDKLFTVVEKVRSDDGAGGAVVTPVEKGQVWASLTPVNAYQKFNSLRPDQETSHIVVCRKEILITSDMFLTWNGRTFGVEAVVDFKEGDWTYMIYTLERTGET